jgi:hypothetical protein
MIAPIWDSIKNYEPYMPSLASNIDTSSFRENKAILQNNYGYEVMTREDIPDVLYFAPYAEVAYIENQCREYCGENLLLFCDDNDLFKSPFYIARDEKWKVVVVSIRGTYSAADWLVDLQIGQEPIPIPELGPNKRHFTHKGIMRTSKNILRQLRENDRLKRMIDDPKSPTFGYDIVVNGHSLGSVRPLMSILYF